MEELWPSSEAEIFGMSLEDFFELMVLVVNLVPSF